MSWLGWETDLYIAQPRVIRQTTPNGRSHTRPNGTSPGPARKPSQQNQRAKKQTPPAATARPSGDYRAALSALPISPFTSVKKQEEHEEGEELSGDEEVR
jgi:hypothetical protein